MEPAATPQEAAHAVDRVPEVERRVLVDRRAVGAALADQVGLQAEPREAVQQRPLRGHALGG